MTFLKNLPKLKEKESHNLKDYSEKQIQDGDIVLNYSKETQKILEIYFICGKKAHILKSDLGRYSYLYKDQLLGGWYGRNEFYLIRNQIKIKEQ